MKQERVGSGTLFKTIEEALATHSYSVEKPQPWLSQCCPNRAHMLFLKRSSPGKGERHTRFLLHRALIGKKLNLDLAGLEE